MVPRQSQGCVGPCPDLSVPKEPRRHPVMGLCRDSHPQLGLQCLPAILRASSQLLSLFFGESFAASAAQTSTLALGLARQVLCTAGLLPAPARTKLSSCKYISRPGLSRDRGFGLAPLPPRKLEFSWSSCPVLLLPLQDLNRAPLQRRDKIPSLRSGTLLLNEFLWPSLEPFVFSAFPPLL